MKKTLVIPDIHGTIYGNDTTQGPTWIRPGALIGDMYFDKQIVGHTEVKKPFLLVKKGKYEIILVDSMDHKKQYVIGEPIDNVGEEDERSIK